MKFVLIFSLSFFIYKCSENPLRTNLDHSTLRIDTLTISNMTAINYIVAPNLGTNERLYIGMKNGLDIDLSLIEIEDTPLWGFTHDTNIVIDSLHFVAYSEDSLLTDEIVPNLYFYPDSQFDENISTYLDFESFSNTDWFDIGRPSINYNNDTSGIFQYTELLWSIDTLLQTLSDTLDSNLVRTFAIQFPDIDSNFIELFSEEATTGETDPKVIMYYRRTVDLGDSIRLDTLSGIIYSNGDLSIIKPNEIIVDSNSIQLSNGMGLRSILQIPYEENTLLKGSVIRSANLILPYDSIFTNLDYNVILDPIENDSLVVDTVLVYEVDPYVNWGFPYRVSADIQNGECILSVKDIMQNINLGNVNNLGFKILSNEKNDPFESIRFYVDETWSNSRLEIIYVSN
ncbi:MAG: hypothetical protein ACJZ12_05150 [Candidatus Neomarinimicrobiota bacterium]